MSSDAQGTTTSPEQQQQTANNNNTAAGTDHKRSSKDSINPITCPFPHTVKEAVAIAAGKKESDGDDDDGKNIRSNMLCYLYWLLVVLILGLISFTVWLSIQLARRHSEMNDHRKNFEFEDIFNVSFQPKSFEAIWIRSDAYVYRSDDGSIVLYNISKNDTKTIVDNSVFEQLKTSSFSLSRDLRLVLFKYDIKKRWRSSFLAKYAIYDTRVKPGVSRLHFFGKDMLNSHEDVLDKHLQYAELAPTSSAAVFVYKNNIFFQESTRKQTRQLTFSGLEGEIFNGINDWTYEGILSKTSAIWWSPDSRYVCYLSINSTLVSKFHFIDYESANGSLIKIPHPKAYPTGPLPNVTVKVVDTDQLKDEEYHYVIYPPPEFKSLEYYVVQVVWQDNMKVAVVWHNRPQNESITTIFNTIDGTFLTIHYQTTSNGWINPSPQLIFIKPITSYLTILPKIEADGTMWDHLALVEQQELQASKVSFLTQGYEEILEIAGFNEETHEVFYLSTNKDPRRRHLFRVNTTTKVPKCITCNISSDCQYVSASFGPGAKYYILGCLGPGTPTYRLKDIHSTINVTLEDNKLLQQALTMKILPDRKFIEVPIGEGLRAWAEVLMPQEEGSKKFPLLIQAVGEPGEQLVSEKFNLGWETYLASKEEVVVAKIGIRGTRGRGSTYSHKTYRKIGEADVEDLLLAGIHLKNHDLVDPAKVAIWGWGFAGFLAMHALANDTDVFPCGISGGALLDINFYDAPTFERYMGLSGSDDNLVGYMKTDVLKKLGHMKNKKLALIQGMADDHIGLTSTYNTINVLSSNDILYRFQIYKDLSSYQLIPHRHAYHMMTDFLKQDCFTYFWKHDTKAWIVDKTAKKDKFRIKQFCV